MKIGVDIIQLSGDTFEDISFIPINALTISNTHTADVTFDLVLGPRKLRLGSTDTDAIYILKNIPIPSGSTFDWESNAFLRTVGLDSSIIRKYDNNRRVFDLMKDGFTFLVRLGSGHTADVLIKRR